jgi:hypothetical protein
MQDGGIKNTKENLRMKNIWYSTSVEAKERVDRRRELICQKTARDCRMEKSDIRMKVWERN